MKSTISKTSLKKSRGCDLSRKASAISHPIQGLIKYHGLRDPLLRLPYHDSISVCTAPLITHTTIEFGDYENDIAVVDGKPLIGHEMERVLAVVEPVRVKSEINEKFRMFSYNSFPSNVGLGASSSGFAALALASCKATNLDVDLHEVSRFARRGAGSATRAVTGAFSKWHMGLSDADSYAVQLANEELQMGMIVALIPAFKQTESAHAEVMSSPFFQGRLAEMPRLLMEMELAIKKKDVGKICALAERDTLMLHGITMTGEKEMLLWKPETVQVILKVRKMRDEGIPAFFSIDTGATVYVNTFIDRIDEVEEKIRELGLDTIRCFVGGSSRLTNDHLF